MIRVPHVGGDVPRGQKRAAKAHWSPVVPSPASLRRGLVNTLLLNLVARTKSLILSLPYTWSSVFPLHRVVISSIVTCSLNDGIETAL